MSQPYNPRSDASQAAYNSFVQSGTNQQFDLTSETILREFDHWVIIKNRFPYDNIARINHLLISREQHANFLEANAATKTELESIKQALATEAIYDAYIENFPKAATVKSHLHIHLIAWHNTG